MIKIDKEFLMTDNSLNCYGYRLLTEGLLLEKFKPAIGYFMHERDKGVAVKWTDLVVRDGALYGKPEIDDTRFPDLAKQIADGFYAAASVGHIVALEWSDDPELKVEGQTGPTVTKWYPRECSIVDIPGNPNAIVQDKLFDEKDNVLMDLSDKLIKTPTFMKELTISVEALLALCLPNLSADATADQLLEVLRDLKAKADKAEGLETELNNLKAEMATLKTQVDSEKINAIVEKALADHKINAAMAEKLKADYKENISGLQALVDAMPTQTLIGSLLSAGQVPEKYQGKTWSELYKMEGALADIKQNYPDLYAKLIHDRDNK